MDHDLSKKSDSLTVKILLFNHFAWRKLIYCDFSISNLHLSSMLCQHLEKCKLP